MDLLSLKPKLSKFKLTSISEDREFFLRPITLEDEVWLSENFDDLNAVFTELRMVEISRIVFRLMTPESKSFFKGQAVITVDEDGNEKEETLGGVAMLRTAISGYDNKINVIVALLECIGLSRPEIKEDEPKPVGTEKKSLDGI